MYKESLCIFSDILGVKEIVKSTSPEEIKELISLFSMPFKSLAMDSVAHFTSDHFSIDEIEIKKREFLNSDDSFGWMSETMDDLEGKRKCTIFSDSVFCTIDLSNDPDKSKTIFKELVRLYEISDLLIQRKILFRGGITIDNVFHATNTIFGPGIISAYELESKHAIFPPVLTHRGFFRPQRGQRQDFCVSDRGIT